MITCLKLAKRNFWICGRNFRPQNLQRPGHCPKPSLCGELIDGIFGDDLQTSDTEISIELNFAILKLKHTIKKKKK
jgi:hypothetical protein